MTAPWEEEQPNAPREVPEWLDIFPASVRVAPKVSTLASLLKMSFKIGHSCLLRLYCQVSRIVMQPIDDAIGIRNPMCTGILIENSFSIQP